jgi:hypothetical protein
MSDAKMNYNEMLKAARPIAIKIAQEIGAEANSGKFPPAAHAGLIASLVLQNIMTSLAIDLFKPGSPEGQAFLDSACASVAKDMAERWQGDDLKFWFDNKHGQEQ